MAQKKIPCWFMRGGTSRGAHVLPPGAPAPRQGNAGQGAADRHAWARPTPCRSTGSAARPPCTTSKVALLAVSDVPGVDIDFHFALVSVATGVVDWGLSCGNILGGVVRAAIEMGLVRNIRSAETKIRIRSVNTGSFAQAVVKTPGGQVLLHRLELQYKNVGSKTGGKLLPTGRLRDEISGVDVTCIDCGMPIVMHRARLEKTGYEIKVELDSDREFFQKLESIRRIAGAMMGLGDVTDRVIPKFAIVAAPRGHQ